MTAIFIKDAGHGRDFGRVRRLAPDRRQRRPQALRQPGDEDVRPPGRASTPATPGAWVFSQKTVDGSGHLVPQFTVGSVCSATKASTQASLDHCVRAHGFLSTDVLQPASRYWLFQGIEAALFGGLAVALLALAVWWVRRRLA